MWQREEGRLLEGMKQRGELAAQGGDRKSNYSDDSLISLKDLDITWVESSFCQMLWQAPEQLILDYFAECEDTEKQITIKGAIDQAKLWLKEQTIEEAAEEAAHVMADDAEFVAPTIYLADALEFMAGFEDDSFDLLLTAPPYSTDIDDIASLGAIMGHLAILPTTSAEAGG